MVEAILTVWLLSLVWIFATIGLIVFLAPIIVLFGFFWLLFKPTEKNK